MSDEIKVHVVRYPDRKNLVMRYVCPDTNRQVQRSTGTSVEKEALKKAAQWEAELQEGRYLRSSRMSWEDFRAYHGEHILSGMKASTAGAYDASLNVFERLANPKRLCDCTTARMTMFATELRKGDRSPATV
ncbi:MAG: hypothetical protein KDA61_04885, partial [Planctomycetales bacterium]|nr:hypothetical protein [Planctomycetales bacterium]